MNPITRFQTWMLRRIFKALLVQGAYHKRNTIVILHLLREAARNEFTEDNNATINAFLEECMKEALKCPRCKGTGQVFIQQGYITIPSACPKCGDSFQKLASDIYAGRDMDEPIEELEPCEHEWTFKPTDNGEEVVCKHCGEV